MLRCASRGELRSSAMPICRLDCRSAGKPRDDYGFCSIIRGRLEGSLDFVKVFHKIYMSRVIDSCRLRQRPLFSPYGLVHDTSTRRGTQPRRGRALVRSCRAAPRISHRTVRDRPLAPLSQRTRLSREHPGSQGRGRNLARSFTREASRDNIAIDLSWLRRPTDEAAARRAIAGPCAPARASGDFGRTAAIDYLDRPESRSCSSGRSVCRAGVGPFLGARHGILRRP